MARKTDLDVFSMSSYAGDQAPEADTQKRKMNPNSLKNIHPRKKTGRSEHKMISLDIYGYEDYLNRMSRYNKVTRTKYIQNLIQKDVEEHKDEYELLKNLSGFDN